MLTMIHLEVISLIIIIIIIILPLPPLRTVYSDSQS